MSSSTSVEPETRERRETDRHVESLATVNAPATLFVGASVPLGLGIAATIATCYAPTEQVAVAAWVAVAVVGSASMIAAAAASKRRITSVHRH